MNNVQTTESERLIERTKADTGVTYCFFAASVFYLIGLIREYVNGGCSDPGYLTNIVFMVAISIVLFIVTRIFDEIRRSGKPFSHSIIAKLRIMAVILIVGGAFPGLEKEIIDGTEYAHVIIDTKNCLVILLGVVICMVSEIFVYGSKLQEDNDSIA